MKKIFISAGEHSGDLHGANLINELRKCDDTISIHGLGKSGMIGAGMNCVHDMAGKSVMWIQALTKVFEFRKIIKDVTIFFETGKPDLVILIDFCGLNFYLAKAAKKLGITVMYYISPQIWAHGIWRVKKLKKLIDKAVVIYPFEEEIYRNADIPVRYVGNPIIDELTKAEPDDTIISRLKNDYGDNIVSLLPGSRSQEVSKILPLLLKTADMLHKINDDIKFIVSCSDERFRESIEDMVKGCSCPVVVMEGNLFEMIKASRLCLAGSGTVTLKIAYHLTPMVVIYKLSYFARFIANPFFQSPFFCLVNKLAEDFIVPERLICSNDNKWILDSARELLENGETRERCINNLKKVKEMISQPGVSKRVAEEALALMG